ncbi:MAG: glycosyltransferase [Candidatus Bathyarchaeota archaeon]|nr:MAG: glycosyltransferase [Candidatus Bathyarchaeota archaeon]
MQISGVVAVHNEAEYLRYSLPALRHVPFDELIFVLDRCTDDSEEIIAKSDLGNSKIVFKEEQKWAFTRAGETFQMGFDRARNDVVFALGADLILAPRALSAAEDLMQHPKVGSVFFGFTQRPIRGIWRRIHEEYINLLKRHLLDRVSPFKMEFTTGVYCFRRSLARLRDAPAEYDDLHDQIRAKGYKAVYVPDAGIIHLRAGLSREKQIWHGRVRARLREPLIKVALHSIVNLKPWTLITFLRCRE